MFQKKLVDTADTEVVRPLRARGDPRTTRQIVGARDGTVRRVVRFKE